LRIFINNDYYSDVDSIPKHYENEPKKIVIEVQEDLYEATRLKNIVSIYLEAIDKTIKVDLSNFKEVEEIYIDYNFGLEKIEGIHELINLRYLGYIGYELDYTYSKLLENILSQIDIPRLLSQPSSYLLLSVFAIPILKRKYPNFFEDFSNFPDKISFSDATDTFLRGQVFSTCTFEEAKQVELITDKWIHENISHTMNDVEKFACANFGLGTSKLPIYLHVLSKFACANFGLAPLHFLFIYSFSQNLLAQILAWHL